jgi:hypothetical protein
MSHLEHVFSRLDRARAALQVAVDSVGPPLRQQRPGPERWSAAEVIEHISIVERIFTGRIADALSAARAGGLAGDAASPLPLPETVETRMADRANKREAPEPARPTGTLDAAAAWEALESGHQRLRTVVAGADDLALSLVSIAHPFFGSMTIYQWVELMAAHEARHTEQIKEIARAFSGSAG